MRIWSQWSSIARARRSVGQQVQGSNNSLPRRSIAPPAAIWIRSATATIRFLPAGRCRPRVTSSPDRRERARGIDGHRKWSTWDRRRSTGPPPSLQFAMAHVRRGERSFYRFNDRLIRLKYARTRSVGARHPHTRDASAHVRTSPGKSHVRNVATRAHGGHRRSNRHSHAPPLAHRRAARENRPYSPPTGPCPP